MDHRQKGFKATVVGLDDKTVCIYKDKFLVNVFSTPDVVSAILFGRFGREEGSLIMITKGMYVKLSVVWCNLELSLLFRRNLHYDLRA